MNNIKRNLNFFMRGFSKHSLNHLIVLIILYVLINIFSMYENAVETYYSRFLFKYISAVLNRISSLIPLSLSEIFLFIFILFIFIYIILFILKLKKLKHKVFILGFLGSSLYKLMCFLLFIYISFMLLWGLNYYRVPLASYLDDAEMNDENVAIVVNMLIAEANSLKSNIKNDTQIHNMNLFISIFKSMNSNFESVYNEFSFLKGFFYSNPKPIFISKLFLYMQISGIYSPFTGEANINYPTPSYTLAFTVSHEMAHQRGIAYEDEANFIAYVANYNSKDLDIQYSAALGALMYCLSSLDKGILYNSIVKNIDKKVIDDIKYISNFWRVYDGPVSTVATEVNDTYLKANAQSDGVKSYSKVVNLIVKYRLSKTKLLHQLDIH